jgi:hypothetical protein
MGQALVSAARERASMLLASGGLDQRLVKASILPLLRDEAAGSALHRLIVIAAPLVAGRRAVHRLPQRVGEDQSEGR